MNKQEITGIKKFQKHKSILTEMITFRTTKENKRWIKKHKINLHLVIEDLRRKL